MKNHRHKIFDLATFSSEEFRAVSRGKMSRRGFLLVISVMGAFLVVQQYCWSGNCSNSSASLSTALDGESAILQEYELAYAKRYNLLTDGMAQEWEAKLAAGTAECSLGKLDIKTVETLVDVAPCPILIQAYANANRLAQDHPCVLQLIRTHFARPPSPRDVPYSFSNYTECDEEWDISAIFDPQGDPSMGQTAATLKLLKNQTEGFFVECGAYDGQTTSNTLYLERTLGWSGLLIEASPPFFEMLSLRNRKSWTLPMCLSIKPYPTEVSFQLVRGVDSVAAHIVDPTEEMWSLPGEEHVTVQCFPFYSIVLAFNRTKVDFFSLDIEGHEFKVVKTIPFEKVDIRVLTAEVHRLPGGDGAKDALIRYMEENGFITYGEIRVDVLFFKDTLNDLPRRTKSGRPSFGRA